MKTVDDFINKVFEDDVKEADNTDPLTLVNLIIRKDARHQGYNWGSPINQVTPEQILQTPMPMQGPGSFVTEAIKEVNDELKKKVSTTGAVQEDSQTPEAQVQTTTGEMIQVEFNKHDPNAHSSLPQVNNCPAFFMKDQQSSPICRVTNRVCIYMNSDYKNCGIYNTASTGDPGTWELPPGKENTYAYLMGLKF